MNKYQRPVSAQERKENIPEAPRPSRPVSAISANNVPPKPTPAWEAALQGQMNRCDMGKLSCKTETFSIRECILDETLMIHTSKKNSGIHILYFSLLSLFYGTSH